ncbi:MAG: DUF3667 domain-containing protein [Dysgonamonadaceae bacterium]|jgi:hypothetical protein|nr:DUF3667 domain-containing protein [Dysgonamonadaceae bacterium]
MQTTTCKNCKCTINKNFCPNCGQPATLRRIDKHYLIHEISEFLFANKGMIYTIKKMLINPGRSTREFIAEDRFRFVKPITFLFITSLVYSLVNYLFHITAEDFYQQSDVLEGSTITLIFDWMLIKYPGYSSIITGLFMAFWVKIFFRKSGYNFFEIFILLCFVSGIQSLFFSGVAIVQGITHWNLMQITIYISIIYLVWSIGQFFDVKKAASYIKAFFSYVLGVLALSIVITIVGTLIDEIIK